MVADLNCIREIPSYAASMRQFELKVKAAKSPDQFRALLAARVTPLVDLGVAKIQRGGFYALTDAGVGLQKRMRDWLCEGDSLRFSHRRHSSGLATLGVVPKSSNEVSLHDTLTTVLSEASRSCWGERRQWPLWETLLLGACAAQKTRAGGFELDDGLAALEQLRTLYPGTVEFAPGRQMNQQYFRLSSRQIEETRLDGAKRADDLLGDRSNDLGSRENADSPLSNGEESHLGSSRTNVNLFEAKVDARDSLKGLDETAVATAAEGSLRLVSQTASLVPGLEQLESVSYGLDSVPQSMTASDTQSNAGSEVAYERVESALSRSPVERCLYHTWLLEIVEDQLLLEEDRPVSVPLLGATTSIGHLLRRLEGLEEESLEEHDKRFWSRLKPAQELIERVGRSKLGLSKPANGEALGSIYGLLIADIQRVFGSDVPSVAALGRKLLRHREGDDISNRAWSARTRLEKSLKALQAFAVELRDQLRQPVDTSANAEKIGLFLRDLIINGRFSVSQLAGLMGAAEPDELLVRLVDLLLGGAREVQSTYLVTLRVDAPFGLIQAMGGPSRHRILRQRQASPDLPEELEITIPGLALDRSPDAADDVAITASAQVVAAEESMAKKRAVQWAQGEVDRWSIAFVTDPHRTGAPAALDLANLRGVSVCAVAATLADPSANAPACEDTWGGEDRAGVELWRPTVDTQMADLALRTQWQATGHLPLGSRADQALERALGWWKRAGETQDPVIRFSCLWSGMEHLLAPTNGLAFTRKLAAAITVQMLRRRGTATVREIAQRVLRFVAFLPRDTPDEYARECYELVKSLCLPLDEAHRLDHELPLEILRGGHRVRRLRHAGLKIVRIRDFVARLAARASEKELLMKLLAEISPRLGNTVGCRSHFATEFRIVT
jgi:hypothetical protein